MVAVTRVPAPAGLSTASEPLRAPTRSASPWIPEPPSSAAPPTPSSRTSTVSRPSRGAHGHRRRLGVRVLADVGQALRRRRSRPPPRPRRAGARRAWPTHLDRQRARARRGPRARPAGRGSVRIAGWMPRARSRSSFSARLRLLPGLAHQLDRGSGRRPRRAARPSRRFRRERHEPLLGAVVQVALDAAGARRRPPR